MNDTIHMFSSYVILNLRSFTYTQTLYQSPVETFDSFEAFMNSMPLLTTAHLFFVNSYYVFTNHPVKTFGLFGAAIHSLLNTTCCVESLDSAGTCSRSGRSTCVQYGSLRDRPPPGRSTKHPCRCPCRLGRGRGRGRGRCG